MKKQFTGFMDFIREQGVVGLAIGFIMGGAVNGLVGSFVNDIIEPAIGLIFGSTEGLQALQYKSIMYGNFLVFLIDFLILMAVVYFGFKMLGLEKLDKKKG